MKRKVFVLLLVLIFFALLFSFARNIYYYNYIEKIIAEENIKIKLVNIIWDDGLNYKINENVYIIDEIQEIVLCKYSDESFFREKRI